MLSLSSSQAFLLEDAMKKKIKIRNLVGDLTYEEIKERKWRHPRIWRKGKKIIFKDYAVSKDGIIIRIEPVKGYKIGKRISEKNHWEGYISFILF